MQRVRLIAVTVGLAACVATFLPGVGVATAKQPSQACAREEFVSGLEVVFGHATTQARAETLQRQVLSRGFQNANIIAGCDYRVVIRGMDTFDVAVALQSEARRERFNATVECIKAKEIGRIEAIFGHGRDQSTAQAIVDRAASLGYVGLKLRTDPCGGYEAYLAGFKDQAEAEVFKAQAKDRGVIVALEVN